MNSREEKLVDRQVTYTLAYEGKFYIVENVPARVDEETGEQFFSPATVERLQKAILGREKPKRVVETPVYDSPSSSDGRRLTKPSSGAAEHGPLVAGVIRYVSKAHG